MTAINTNTLTFKVGRRYTCALTLPAQFAPGFATHRMREDWWPRMPLSQELSIKAQAQYLARWVQAIASIPSRPGDERQEFLISQKAYFFGAEIAKIALPQVTEPLGAKLLAAWIAEQETAT
jgi:hypothetical protein